MVPQCPAICLAGCGGDDVVRRLSAQAGRLSIDHSVNLAGQAPRTQKACNTLKPPMNMRLPSTGMVLPMSLNDGSSLIACIAWSRSSRDLYTAHDNMTISSLPSCTACGNDVCLPGFTSSAMQSTYSTAPCFLT